MIKLEVQDYCQNCDCFEADVECERLYALNKPVVVETTIKCGHRHVCENVKKHFEKESLGNG